MALKNMIKLKDKVTFGRSGEKKVAGRVVKLNPKTAHIKCSNGDVMRVTYGLIQKPSSKHKAPAAKRKAAKRSPIGRRYTKAPAKSKRNPYGSFAQTRASKPTSYTIWLAKQPKGDLKKLDVSLSVLLRGSGRGLSGLKSKQVEVRKELRTRR